MKKQQPPHHLAAPLPIPAPCWSKRGARAPYKGSVSLSGTRSQRSPEEERGGAGEDVPGMGFNGCGELCCQKPGRHQASLRKNCQPAPRSPSTASPKTMRAPPLFGGTKSKGLVNIDWHGGTGQGKGLAGTQVRGLGLRLLSKPRSPAIPHSKY